MTLKSSQSGVASLMVTMVLMIVISLIVLGFAQVARNEQRNTLDRQLSTQAFYAAETGINDAQSAITTALSHNQPITPKTQCTSAPSGSIYSSLSYKVNPTQGVSYTCVLVTTNVPQLQKTLGVDQEWVTEVNPVDNSGAQTTTSSLNFTWPPDDPTNTGLSGCPASVAQGYIQNLSFSSWSNCAYGALRIDIVPVAAGADPTRVSLTNSDMVVYAYPPQTAGGSSYGTYQYNNGLGSSSSSHQVFADCNAGGVHTCTLLISGLPSGLGTTYYVRAHMFYKDTGADTLKIDANNPAIYFSGAQAQIDATGKAQDVLRRIRVTVPFTSNLTYSPDAILSRDSICKRYSVSPGVKPNNQVPPGNAADTANPTC